MCCRLRFTLIEILFAEDVVLLERLPLGDRAHRPPMIARDALNLDIAQVPHDKVATVQPYRSNCTLDLSIILTHLLEHVVAVELPQMMLPFWPAPDISRRIGPFEFEDAHRTCGMRVSEVNSTGRGTHDVFWNIHSPLGFSILPTMTWYEAIASDSCSRPPLNGRDVLEILRSIDIVAELLHDGWVRLAHHIDREPKLRRWELSITISNPIVVLTLARGPKDIISNFLGCLLSLIHFRIFERK